MAMQVEQKSHPVSLLDVDDVILDRLHLRKELQIGCMEIPVEVLP